jgi:hypothetical protein
MAVKAEINWKELESKGFIVIPSFLSIQEINYFCKDYEQISESKDHSKYELVDINQNCIQKFKETSSVKKCIENVCDIGIKADTILGGCYFSTFKKQNYHWHQDQVSYYTCQNHHDYLNFYIPIIKPVKEKSNISILPFDTLKQIDHICYEKIIHKGAVDYKTKNGKTHVYENDQFGKIIHTLNIDINEYAISPNLNAGDLLLMRGDIIHRTQDAETNRLAISIRSVNSMQLIDYNMLISGTKSKLLALIENRVLFQYLIKVFRKVKQDKILVKDLLNIDYGVVVKNNSALIFLMELIYLRLKKAYPLIFKNKF